MSPLRTTVDDELNHSLNLSDAPVRRGTQEEGRGRGERKRGGRGRGRDERREGGGRG